ncbi:SRPBCC family protein [Streptomyces mirabilis]|uniref:SRPBCC family protein n=1 Tax=Streptomyces mirabilis TaxID=68239 RepID=UPI003673FA70
MWNDFPREETRGSCRAFTCKYHAWRYDLTGKLAFVQQESEFFDLDKDDYGLLPVHCEVWAGFVFVNLAKEPEQTLPEFLGPMITPLDGPHRMVTPGGTNPGKVRKWSMDNFQIFPNMEILIWASGWYLTYRYWPTSHHTHRFEGTLFFPKATTASERATQELLVRHFRRSIADCVEEYERKTAGVRTGVRHPPARGVRGAGTLRRDLVPGHRARALRAPPGERHDRTSGALRPWCIRSSRCRCASKSGTSPGSSTAPTPRSTASPHRCPDPARRPPEPSRPTTHDHRDPHARCRRERCTR